MDDGRRNDPRRARSHTGEPTPLRRLDIPDWDADSTDESARPDRSPWLWILLAVALGTSGYLALARYGGTTHVLQEVAPALLERFGQAWGSASPSRTGLPMPSDTTNDTKPWGEPAAPAEDTTGAGPSLTIGYVAGDGQEAPAGTVLPELYEVQITDEAQQPVMGAEVRFDVISGDGVATPSVTRTDSLGRASAAWRLGSTPGFQGLRASSPQAGITVTFTAMSRASGEVPDAPPEREATAAAPDVRRPSVTVTARRFATGGSMVCTLSAPGTRVTCRGANDRGQLITEGAPGSQAVTAGLFHVCALDASGAASCWGANEAGQLGDGSREDRATPSSVATDLRFSTLSAGSAHTCGLTVEGRAACWGRNLGGQLGDGSREDRLTPGRASMQSFERIIAGWNHTCGVTATRVAYCWGLNRDGQVGDGSRLDRLVPHEIMTDVSDLAAGSAHTCAIAAGRVQCWGDNRSGQLGDGSTGPHATPEPVVDLPDTPVSIVAGAAHTCALFRDGTARCWGQNVYGQLGDGGTVNAVTPVPVAGGLSFQQLSAGGAVTCGLTALGTEYCWGLNQSGQLGDGTLTNRAAPTLVRR